MAGVFDAAADRRLLVFTTRVRRRDGRALTKSDLARLLAKAATRKLPRPLKYLPRLYELDPVVFATNLPAEVHSEFVRPLTCDNYQFVRRGLVPRPHRDGTGVGARAPRERRQPPAPTTIARCSSTGATR